jgi:MFS transporter, SP family, arabinose:H+ symporter
VGHGPRVTVRWAAQWRIFCLRARGILYVLSAMGCAFAWSWPALVAYRVIGGLAIGGSSVIGPMYIAEIAPAAKRGRLVGFFQFSVVFGILCAYLSKLPGSAGGSGRR